MEIKDLFILCDAMSKSIMSNGLDPVILQYFALPTCRVKRDFAPLSPSLLEVVGCIIMLTRRWPNYCRHLNWIPRLNNTMVRTETHFPHYFHLTLQDESKRVAVEFVIWDAMALIWRRCLVFRVSHTTVSHCNGAFMCGVAPLCGQWWRNGARIGKI